MVRIEEKDYNRDITEFAKLSTGDVWTLHKINGGIVAKQSAICRFGDQVINRQSQFMYNRKIPRVELWFMFYCRNGRPLRVREFAEIIGTNPEANDTIVIELSTHPTLHIPYYKLYENPEDNSDLTSLLDDSYGDNYIRRWIAAFGAEAGLCRPTEYTIKVPHSQSESNVDTSSSSCSQSITSTDGT